MTQASVATAAEAVEYLQYSGFGLVEADIPATVVKLAKIDIASWLDREEVIFDTIEELRDDREYIWAASFCQILEFLAMRGQMQMSSGDVAEVKAGKVETKMQRWQPMFFFAKGMARGFWELLPHDTYRTLKFQMLKSWKMWRFRKTRPTEVKFGTAVGNIGTDDTTTTFPDVMSEINFLASEYDYQHRTE